MQLFLKLLNQIIPQKGTYLVNT